MKKMPSGYGMVQTKIMQIKDLSMQAKALYCLYASMTGSNDFCFPSIKNISEWTGIAERSVRRYNLELEARNLIKKEKLNPKSFSRSNKYTVNYV